MSSRRQPDHSLGPGLTREPRVTGHSGKHASPHRASTRLEQARAQLRSLLPPGAGLLLPRVSSVAQRATPKSPALEAARSATLRMTCLGGLAGTPAISMPLTQVAGLLVGTSALAAPGADRNLADLA